MTSQRTLTRRLRKQSGHLSRRVARSWRSARASRAERETSRRDAHLVADVHQPSAGIGAEEELDEVELACARRWGRKVSAGLSDLRKRGEAERRMTHPRRTPCAAASVRPRRGTSRASTRALPQRTPRSTPRCLPRLSPPSRRVKSSPPVRVFSFQPAPALATQTAVMQLLVLSARLPRRNESPHIESIEIFSLYRCRARKIKPWFTGNPPLAPLGRPVEGDLFQRFSPQKRSKG